MTYVAPGPAAPPASTLRVWDTDWTEKFTLDATAYAHVSIDQRTITLPSDHEAAQWILAISGSDIGGYLTIDTASERWAGVLRSWKISRVGSCPECAHCMQKTLKTMWLSLG